MENNLEQLLNILIQRGWHPFGRKYNSETGGDHNTISFNYYDNIDEERGLSNFSIRELVSKESGLWQFACKNEMVNIKYCDRRCYDGDRRLDKACFDNDYEYRIIQSALCNEDKLEEFLLSNIKVNVDNRG